MSSRGVITYHTSYSPTTTSHHHGIYTPRSPGIYTPRSPGIHTPRSPEPRYVATVPEPSQFHSTYQPPRQDYPTRRYPTPLLVSSQGTTSPLVQPLRSGTPVYTYQSPLASPPSPRFPSPYYQHPSSISPLCTDQMSPRNLRSPDSRDDDHGCQPHPVFHRIYTTIKGTLSPRRSTRPQETPHESLRPGSVTDRSTYQLPNVYSDRPLSARVTSDAPPSMAPPSVQSVRILSGGKTATTSSTTAPQFSPRPVTSRPSKVPTLRLDQVVQSDAGLHSPVAALTSNRPSMLPPGVHTAPVMLSPAPHLVQPLLPPSLAPPALSARSANSSRPPAVHTAHVPEPTPTTIASSSDVSYSSRNSQKHSEISQQMAETSFGVVPRPDRPKGEKRLTPRAAEGVPKVKHSSRSEVPSKGELPARIEVPLITKDELPVKRSEVPTATTTTVRVVAPPSTPASEVLVVTTPRKSDPTRQSRKEIDRLTSPRSVKKEPKIEVKSELLVVPTAEKKSKKLPKIERSAAVKFSWALASGIVNKRRQPAESFSLNGIPFDDWDLTKIPTLGASPTSCRVQEMYKALIPSGDGSFRVFVKTIPIKVWDRQWEQQIKWRGEYVTDGENFAMEAAALAFLHEHGPGLAPKLLGILELNKTTGEEKYPSKLKDFETSTEVSHIAIISELYGEDLLDYLDKLEKEKQPLTIAEKKELQWGCVRLMKKLHTYGFAHLDFTPENVLRGPDGLRLCDFAKATPLWSQNHRHVSVPSTQGVFGFESCEPTVGKGAYMPPECWKVYWKLESTKVQYPLDELWTLAKPEDRAGFYFRVRDADVYMLGVLLFWIWSDGGIWKCSDSKQDDKYNHLVKSGMNFNLFRECRSWPAELKDMLMRALRPEPWRRVALEDVINHEWFTDMQVDKKLEAS